MVAIAELSVNYSFSQIQIYDKSVAVPACLWTRGHAFQGFSRRSSTASFSTLLSAGTSSVTIYLSEYIPSGLYRRVICIPFEVLSGSIAVGAPDDWPHNSGFVIGSGYYKLCVAQLITDNDELVIHMYFEKLLYPLPKSTIVVCDDGLKLFGSLIEDSPLTSF